MKALSVLLLFVPALVISSAHADDHATPSLIPIEVYGCSYNEGKDLDDLLQVAKSWEKWIDREIPQAGFAFVLSPYLVDSANGHSDIYWVNVNSTFESMGSAMDEWGAKGGKYLERFNEVCTSDNHSMFVGYPITPPNDDEAAPFQMTFQVCNAKDGATMQKRMAADQIMLENRDKYGLEGGMMRWFPMAGMDRSIEFDFLNVSFVQNSTTWGRNMDKYVANMQSIGPNPHADLQECTSGEVWSGVPVRDPRS